VRAKSRVQGRGVRREYGRKPRPSVRLSLRASHGARYAVWSTNRSLFFDGAVDRARTFEGLRRRTATAVHACRGPSTIRCRCSTCRRARRSRAVGRAARDLRRAPRRRVVSAIGGSDLGGRDVLGLPRPRRLRPTASCRASISLPTVDRRPSMRSSARTDPKRNRVDRDLEVGSTAETLTVPGPVAAVARRARQGCRSAARWSRSPSRADNPLRTRCAPAVAWRARARPRTPRSAVATSLGCRWSACCGAGRRPRRGARAIRRGRRDCMGPRPPGAPTVGDAPPDPGRSTGPAGRAPGSARDRADALWERLERFGACVLPAVGREPGKWPRHDSIRALVPGRPAQPAGSLFLAPGRGDSVHTHPRAERGNRPADRTTAPWRMIPAFLTWSAVLWVICSTSRRARPTRLGRARAAGLLIALERLARRPTLVALFNALHRTILTGIICGASSVRPSRV